MTWIDPKLGTYNFLLLIVAQIQTSYGCLPQAWGSLLDARVGVCGIEMVNRGNCTENCFYFMWVVLIQLAFDVVAAAIRVPSSEVQRRFFPRSPNQFAKLIGVYFAHLGLGCLLFPARLTDRQLRRQFLFLEEFLLLVSDFSLWHCCTSWLFSVVLWCQRSAVSPQPIAGTCLELGNRYSWNS